MTQKNVHLLFAFVYNSGTDRQSDWFYQQELPNKNFECPLYFVYSCSSKLEKIYANRKTPNVSSDLWIRLLKYQMLRENEVPHSCAFCSNLYGCLHEQGQFASLHT